MRWPLKRQIMLPMAAIMLATVLMLGGLCAILAVRATKSRIEAQIAGVTQILQTSNFPLTDAVLQKMKALSGAELLVLDRSGKLLHTSGATRPFVPLLAAKELPDRRGGVISLGDHLWTRNGGYFHTAMALTGRRAADEAATLHIFYPQRDYRRAWQHAVYPSLAFVALALPAVVLVAGWTAGRVSRRMNRLQAQVGRIAEGDFAQLELGDRDDEIRALGEAVNRMAALLARYEDDVRRTERTRTLARLGGGIAHQLRNSATGCRIALDLHAGECSSADRCESLTVAKNQLQLMDEFIQRFLRLGNPAQERQEVPIDLGALVDGLIPLMRPAARHSGVTLDWQMPIDRFTVAGDAAMLTQLVINLLDNAIAAAAQSNLRSPSSARVAVTLSRPAPGSFRLTVADTGPGPPTEISDELFEPFVTSKTDGIGLGLSVARDVARQHSGRMFWQRDRDMTEFCVELPAVVRRNEPAGSQANALHCDNQPEMQCA
jgi:signal transduction histidine kinase